ncbi:MAG: tetratricopeptide repeat protein [Methanoregulaceae archaeon]|nr:tetratricopeptide repeat protein [Methanoregulaceae archaeon]
MNETELPSKEPEVWVNRGNVLLLKGKYQEAVKAYDQALTLNAGYEVAKTNKTIATAALKEMPAAEASTGKPGGAEGGLFEKFSKWLKG